ncbi:MAG: deoxyribodipyrimidine photolyase [Flavobacteriaceae bacterium]|nr:deoxyribodipyrimidine photolyase [Flavobacteriaceae bacterium]
MQQKQIKSLLWFTKDLRPYDHEGLQTAIRESSGIIGVYCIDKEAYTVAKEFGFSKRSKFQLSLILEALEELKKGLQSLNIPLIVFDTTASECLTHLLEEYQIDQVILQEEWSFEEQKEVENLKSQLPNILFKTYLGQLLWHPEDVPYNLHQNELPDVFTVFRKKCEKQARVRPLIINHSIPTNCFKQASSEIPTLQSLGLPEVNIPPSAAFKFHGGYQEAQDRLHAYFFENHHIARYKKTRNGLLGTEYSSKFSPWLAIGALSPRYIYHKIKSYEKKHVKNQDTYWLAFELMWRDYFKYISLEHGNHLFKQTGIKKRQYYWKQDKREFLKWVNGQTGDSFVDANMIELQQTGFMSNRGRQNVASYLTKDLQIDWRWGAAYFESVLIDYDVHSNWGNWQYVSGVGNDPRDRKFNTQLQAERYDPKQEFQKLWLNHKH